MKLEQFKCHSGQVSFLVPHPDGWVENGPRWPRLGFSKRGPPHPPPSVATPLRITEYTYDALGRLETVVEDRDAAVATDALLTTTYQYDLVGNLDLTLLPGGVIEDGCNRVSSLNP